MTPEQKTFGRMIVSDVINSHNQVQEQCITKALEAYLGREITDDDFRKCARLFENDAQVFLKPFVLTYDNVKLGVITTVSKRENDQIIFESNFDASKEEL